jgi:hypothetical protein
VIPRKNLAWDHYKGKVKKKKKGEFGCQFVDRGSPGVSCRRQNNGNTMLSPPTRKPAIQKFVEYGMGKRSFGLVI